MTEASAASDRVGSVAYSPLPTFASQTLRARLVAGMKEHIAQFEEHAVSLAALTGDGSGESAARERAMAALDLYRAREAIEEIESALARVEDGSYGTCQSCERPISFERLEALPSAAFCATCLAPAPFSAERSASRRGRVRGEHTGEPPPPTGVLAASTNQFTPQIGEDTWQHNWDANT